MYLWTSGEEHSTTSCVSPSLESEFSERALSANAIFGGKNLFRNIL